MKKLFSCLLAFSFLLLSPLQTNPSQVSVVTYQELVIAIRQTRAQSRQRVEQAVEQEKVREAWEIGKLIDVHILAHKERADYGQHVVEHLSSDLGMSKRELHYMVEFARAYPIVQPAAQLTWSHYMDILALNDEKERQEVTAQAVREHWTRNQVREEVRRRNARAGSSEKSEQLTASPGMLYAYRVLKAKAGHLKDQLVLDLGFANYFQPEGISKFRDGESVLLEKGKLKKINASDQDLWTYQAYVTQVVDGDTFDAVIDLGFKITTLQRLRLRGLDAREIESAEGLEAKKFLEKKLKKSPVMIRTEKSDKYDRYLADVFVNGKYVNQELVNTGLATIVSE